MKRSVRLLSAATVAALASALVAACGSSSNPVSAPNTSSTGSAASSTTVTIGSANFTENEILMDAYAAVLRAKGITVKTQPEIGSREIYLPLIESGKLTIIPEYNGALLSNFDKSTTATTQAATDSELKTKLPSQLSLLNDSAAEDKDSLNVTQKTATQYGLSTIADLSKTPSSFKIGAPPEFATRLQGLLGLKSVYGLDLASRFVPLDEAGARTIAALTGGNVGVADIFSTDASIAANNFVTLSDPKGLFGAQNVVPLVYTAGVNSTITDALNAFSAKLTTKDLLDMVGKVTNDHDDATTIANDFVKSLNLS
jgi:osmoprotectant transport system substrate-binding protein